MWYLDRFSLTPYDDRYLKLSFEWMEYSYHRYMNNIDYGTIRNFHIKSKIEKRKKDSEKKELETQLSTYGNFSPVEMKDVLKAFEEAKK